MPNQQVDSTTGVWRDDQPRRCTIYSIMSARIGGICVVGQYIVAAVVQYYSTNIRVIFPEILATLRETETENSFSLREECPRESHIEPEVASSYCFKNLRWKLQNGSLPITPLHIFLSPTVAATAAAAARLARAATCCVRPFLISPYRLSENYIHFPLWYLVYVQYFN